MFFRRFINVATPDEFARGSILKSRLLFLDSERGLFRLNVICGDIALRTAQLTLNAVYAIHGLYWRVRPGGDIAASCLEMSSDTSFTYAAVA